MILILVFANGFSTSMAKHQTWNEKTWNENVIQIINKTESLYENILTAANVSTLVTRSRMIFSMSYMSPYIVYITRYSNCITVTS